MVDRHDKLRISVLGRRFVKKPAVTPSCQLGSSAGNGEYNFTYRAGNPMARSRSPHVLPAKYSLLAP